MSWVKNSCFK